MGNHNSGPRPRATALKVLRGERRGRVNEHEPRVPDGVVTKPSHLSAGAVRVWDRLAPLCVAMQTLTPADVTAFGTFCELQAAFELLKPTVRMQEGRRRAASALRPYYALFGLEPVSRGRIRVPPEPPRSKWDGYLP